MGKIVGTPIVKKRRQAFTIASPITHLSYPYHLSMVGLVGNPNSEYLHLTNFPIEYARNFLTEQFLKNDKNDYLLFADSDAVFPPYAALRLMERDLPMVCGIFFKRTFPIIPTMGKLCGENVYHFGNMASVIYNRMKDKIIETGAVMFDKKEDDLYEVDGCGMHFTMIRRDVFEKLKPPYFVCTKESAGEDFYFCRKVKEAGFPIYADMSLFVGHATGDSTMHGLGEFMMASEGMLEKFEEWEVAV